MKQNRKISIRITCIILAAIMLLGVVPASALSNSFIDPLLTSSSGSGWNDFAPPPNWEDVFLPPIFTPESDFPDGSSPGSGGGSSSELDVNDELVFNGSREEIDLNGMPEELFEALLAYREATDRMVGNTYPANRDSEATLISPLASPGTTAKSILPTLPAIEICLSDISPAGRPWARVYVTAKQSFRVIPMLWM